jgi:hypothetical protein
VPLVLVLIVLGMAARSVSAFRPDAGSLVEAAAIGHSPPAPTRAPRRARIVRPPRMRDSQPDPSNRTLAGASLTGADLRGADLRGKDLTKAALLGAHLRDANLAGAVLYRADLHYAVLIDADLRNADLRWANLQWADLQDADLRGARLTYARLHRAYLRGAILPDGTPWRPDRDLERFTDPAHPAYWMGTVE